MNLRDTWKNCLAMWKWIAMEYLKAYPQKLSVYRLKAQWLKDHGFKNIECDCFFCEYDNARGCIYCPGTFVDSDFDCYNKEYQWSCNPIAFYMKIADLNRQRNRRKK